ncbi:MAG: hypothetical protein E7331_01145 [Clostridiales bacterium]|nr:hypothetical protein [Clostridiales bacterium]
MNENRELSLKPNREELGGNLDTGLLKVLALVFMLTDHIGAKILPGVNELRILGRIALPLYAWCLVVGNVKTRHPFEYCLRLFCLAVISQPIYMMAMDHPWNYFSILFLLFIATLAIQGIRWGKYLSQIWAPVLCYGLIYVLDVHLGIDIDYGWKGLTFILLLYLARKTPGGLAATFFAFCLFWGGNSSITTLFGVKLTFLRMRGIGDMLKPIFRRQAMALLALPLILIPTKSGLKLPKWLGYAIYPLHLLVIMALRMIIAGVPVEHFLKWFH